MKPNLAERAARWSAGHWKIATAGWLAFIVAAVVAGKLAGTVQLTDAEQSTGESARAHALIEAGGLPHYAGESILVESRRETVSDPSFRATLVRLANALRVMPEVRKLTSPLEGASGQVSRARHSALVQFRVSGPAETADQRIQPVLDRVAALQRSTPGFTIAEFGDASAEHGLNQTVGRRLLARGETFAASHLSWSCCSRSAPSSRPGCRCCSPSPPCSRRSGWRRWSAISLHAAGATNSVMLLIGMAVGVDYSLFYLKREREERRRLIADEALCRAAATSGARC